MSYNPKRHIELFNRSQSLENQGKTLYSENQQEYSELLHYDAAIQSEIFWENRMLVFQLMENFVNRKINGEQFNDSFLYLHRQSVDEFNKFMKELSSKNVKASQLDPRSIEYSKFITFLRLECDEFTDNYENPEFYDSIKKCFLRIQPSRNNE